MDVTDLCPFCGGELSDVRTVGHASRHDSQGKRQPCSWFYEATCISCELSFQRSITGQAVTSWRASRCNVDWLTERLTSRDLAAMSTKLSPARYPKMADKWLAFMNVAKELDVFWKFADPETNQAGIAIVRGGVPVADFWIPGNL